MDSVFAVGGNWIGKADDVAGKNCDVIRQKAKEAAAELLAEGTRVAQAKVVAQGRFWGSHWWGAEFSGGLAKGSYTLQIKDRDKVVLEGEGFRVAANILWDSTVEIMATEMMEARARIAPAGCGWQDAGGVWQESNTQSAIMPGLCDLLEFAPRCFRRQHLRANRPGMCGRFPGHCPNRHSRG